MHDIKIICAISSLPETARTSTDTDPLMSVSILNLFKDFPPAREYKKNNSDGSVLIEEEPCHLPLISQYVLPIIMYYILRSYSLHIYILIWANAHQ